MTRRALTTTLALLFLSAAAAGCSSSSKQTTDDEAATAEQAAQQEEAEAEPEAKKEKEPAGPTVEPETIVGSDTSGGLPEGCPKEWATIKGRSFPGTVYACDGFRAPKRYPEASVVIGVKEEKVRRVSVQAFYDSKGETSDAYFKIKDDFQQRCDREGGTGRHVVLQCDGYLADLQMFDETNQIRLVFGLENWDLPN